MNYSPKNSKSTFFTIAALIVTAALACWQFYEYVTYRHDNGLFNIQGGVSHLVFAVLLAFVACGLGFVIASKFMRYDAAEQLHITSPPSKLNSNYK